MNKAHLELCSSDYWMTHLGTTVVPWALERVALGGRLLEIGSGPGAATRVLRESFEVTAVEYDVELAAALIDQFENDPRVHAKQGDATKLDEPDGRYDAAACFTMLHHIPSREQQDQVFAELARVLRPGGVFFGTDSLAGPGFFRLHEGDICVPVDPTTLADRLEAAGFVDVDLEIRGEGVRWTCSTPEPTGARVQVREPFLRTYISDEFRHGIVTDWVPQLLEVVDLGNDPLHLDAGPADAAEPLRAAAPRLTVAQLDPAFTPDLRARAAADLEIVDVDPLHLPFDDNRFTAATVFLSLMHLRSARTQDAALRELHRVLRPGATFAGLNALDGNHFRGMNDHDRAVPIDPFAFAARLEAAGFSNPKVDYWSFPRFTAQA
ncbi:class I SAM-dependent methyltransferase [Kribbella italica]|uniref:Ubiquinone/menaquinone biosynthesis C-methylase UbiE n=1 Tax=Kribbella italica TaxID=1540520 RepID=A0A7W9JBY5_9ACTN|nr:class I SAM-dependent methyltransferase [Kribbella italica]MBB5839139.1 ubiquinone/menaquinone biosynthesis C-methylase UbiE [Kribbella italica]